MTTPATGILERDPAGFWPWFFQRVSGLMLIALLAVHIWMSHFSGLGAVIDGRQQQRFPVGRTVGWTLPVRGTRPWLR